MTFLKAPLHILTVLYGGVAVLLAVVGVVSVVGNKEKSQNMISVQKRENKITFYFALALLLIICQIVMCALLAHMDADDSFFVAKMCIRDREDPIILETIRNQAIDVDPLYGIFTSGSTGTPKGVVVGHRSVLDFIDCFTELFNITEKDVIGNQAPWDFDVSVKDIYSGLKTGATVQIIPKQLFSFPTKLIDFLIEREVTTLVWAVSALCIISTLNGFEYKVPEKINKILFSGESMPVKHLNIWRKYLPDTMYVNIYGPTEITCNCTYYVVNREFQPGEDVYKRQLRM